MFARLTSVVVSSCGKQLYSVFARVSLPASLICATLSFAMTVRGSVFMPACGHSVRFVPEGAPASRKATGPVGVTAASIFAARGEPSEPGAAVPDQSTTNTASAQRAPASANSRLSPFSLVACRIWGARGDDYTTRYV